MLEKQTERQQQIYRYGLCMLVHYRAARRLYDENTARLLGPLLATTYAVFKYGGRGKTERRVPFPRPIEGHVVREDIDTIVFGGFEIALHPKGNPTKAWLVNYPNIAASIGEFDKVMRKVERSEYPPFEGVEELVAEIDSRLRRLSDDDLKTRRVFDVYRELRDDIEFGKIKKEGEGWTTPSFTS